MMKSVFFMKDYVTPALRHCAFQIGTCFMADDAGGDLVCGGSHYPCAAGSLYHGGNQVSSLCIFAHLDE